MSWADAVNATFEAGASIAILVNWLKLLKDKQVHGVHPGPVAFFAAWGFWNLYYYPSLGQALSFAAGIAVVTTNVLWLVTMIYYLRRKTWHRIG